jgi:hypothetical protein
MDKDQKQRVANIDTLRSLHNNNVELRHRVDGKTMTFPADQYPDGLENSGYNPDDWILSSEFEGPEGADHPEEVDPNSHPAFKGTGQTIGTHLGTTAAERAAVGDTGAERTLGHIPPAGIEADGKTAAQTIKDQQQQTSDGSKTGPAPNASDKVAAETKK